MCADLLLHFLQVNASKYWGLSVLKVTFLRSFFGGVSLSVSSSLFSPVVCFCSSAGLSVLKCERKCRRIGKLLRDPFINCVCFGNKDTNGLPTDGLLTKVRPI